MGRRWDLQIKLAFTLTVAVAAGAQQTPVAEVKVTGASSLPVAAIVAASGLRTGQPATPKDLDAGMNRLFETGLLTSVKYRYDPGPRGLAVTWIVVEDSANLPVELDVAGVDEAALWKEVKAINALIRESMPENENATAYYRRAIEAALEKLGRAQPVVGKVEGDLATGKLSMVFRAANAPKVAAFRFEGNSAVATASIESALTVVAKGQEYSERQFRKLLDLNVRPLYEEHGYLTVKFSDVKIDRETVTTRIDEGPQWQLGKVQITGDSVPSERMLQAAKFPEGQLANWKLIETSIREAEKIPRSEGYLRVQSRPVRRFREGAPVVDLTLEVQRGPQFTFGELRISGFSEALRQRAVSMWKLKPGEPMNEPYVADFLRSLGAAGMPFQTVNLNVEPRPGTNVVDIVLDFK